MLNWTEIRIAALGNERRKDLLPKVKLPALPRALTQFCRKVEDPTVSNLELANIIETDVSLTCELLKHVNSAQFGLRTKVASAQQALGLLGLRNTKLLLLTAGTKLAVATRECKLINVNNFWNANLERAIFAREVALLLKADADLAFAGGMLQDFVLPLLTNECSDTYLKYLADPAAFPRGLAEFELQELQWNHAQVGANLMFDWGFPDDLILATLFHHRGLELLCDKQFRKTALAAVAVSSLIPDAIRQNPTGLNQLMKLEQIWPALKLGEIAVRVESLFAELSSGAAYDFSLRHQYERHLKKIAQATNPPVAQVSRPIA